MSKRIALALSAAALLLSAPLGAQTVIPTDQAKPWTHAPSGFRIATSVDGFERLDTKDFGKTQSDVATSFSERATGTFTTLYFFRAGIPDVSIWADRSEGSIKTNASKVFGDLDLGGRRWTTFSPWGNSKEAGLRLVYPVSGKEVSATGLLLVRHGDWLIKVRMTSTKLNAAQLDARLASFFAALKLEAPKQGGTPAYEVKPCASPLPNAKVKQFEMDASEAVLPMMVEALNDAAPSKPLPPYCRQDGPNPSFTIYRPGASVESYVIAVGDGGMTVRVLPWPMASKGRNKPFVSALLYTNDLIVGFPRFDATPGWQQAIEVVNNSRPSFEQGRTPETRKEIKVFMPGK